jgi:ribosomal protein S12 methylthiotransferase
VDAVRRFLDGLRERIPDVALRTAFIVGHPGETPEAFDNLIDFVRAVQFDMVGAFIYSAEVGTRSAKQPGTVPEVVARSRYHKLMAEQQAISLARNKAWVGRSLDVLLEGFDEEADIVTGRSFRSAPEIDGLVAIEEASQPLTIGEIVEVQVVGALPYDLLAKV